MNASLSEIRLAQAVVNTLLAAGIGDTAICDIEFYPDDIPAYVANNYIAVSPNGFQLGPRHAKSGGVVDLIYSLKVTVTVRRPAIPKDRDKNVWVQISEPLRAYVDGIITLVDFDYDVMNAANTLLTADGESDLFHHPLVFGTIDPSPRVVDSTVFKSVPGEPNAGFARTMVFTNARRTVRRT